MIHPSYSELIEAINENAKSEENDKTLALNSRYSLVLATSKRARQLIAGAEPLVDAPASKKPLSIAIDELYQGKVKIEEDIPEEEAAADEAKADSPEGTETAASIAEASDEGAGAEEEVSPESAAGEGDARTED